MNHGEEFARLKIAAETQSGCAKKKIAAGTWCYGNKWVQAVNFCTHEGEVCPRLNMPSGAGYEPCKAQHAEANLAAHLAAMNFESDGIAWVYGHYWACEPCAAALRKVGVVEIRVREKL